MPVSYTHLFLKDDENGGLMLSRDANVSGKLLVKEGGKELTDGAKTYDANAVVFTDPIVKVSGSNVENATYTYVWQKKVEDGTYATLADLTDSIGPADAGDYAAVSYTHLDVYKRQVMMRTVFSFRISRISAAHCPRLSASCPAVGSSSMTMALSDKYAVISVSRCICPPEREKG